VEPVRWHEHVREGTRLLCADFGGSGPAVILLHGLAGYAGEWGETAAWLTVTNRVVAPDQRGHGRSERRPRDISRAAFVADAAMWIEHLQLAPAVVVGQSLGGHTAFLLAAERPDLVRGLVVAEATPEADPDAPSAVRSWLALWPLPFASDKDALAFFGGDTPWARVWAGGLERREDGFWPAFDADVMVAALEEGAVRPYWAEWADVRCPTLVVRAQTASAPSTLGHTVVEIEGAGHDLHLDQPLAWRRTLAGFLAELDHR
jgi:pimeloyl-ACP methyl ester carboxylesterase